MMPRMGEGSAPRHPRRTLLAAAVTLPLVGGCGVRLEEGAPPVPLVPTRTPLPGEDLLVALTRECVALAEEATRTPGEVAGALVPVHRRQHTVLRTTLVRLGVPVEVVDGTPPASSPGTRATSAAATLGRAEASSAARAPSFALAPENLRPTLAALHAQRYAAAVLLTGEAAGPPARPLGGDVVTQLAAQTAGAIYFLEVVAARTSGSVRTRASRTLEALGTLLDEQLAGGAQAPEALGHPLPFPVRTRADATRLARESLGTLRAAYGPRLDSLLGSRPTAGWAATTRWLGAVEAQCHRWSLPLEPFPGLE